MVNDVGGCGYDHCEWITDDWCTYTKCEGSTDQTVTLDYHQYQYIDVCNACGACQCSFGINPRERTLVPQCPADEPCQVPETGNSNWGNEPTTTGDTGIGQM